MGPDVGYFPGGDRFLSDLTHYVRTGQLACELVQQARSEVEAAFAWGWVTHILGDVLIHPLLNQAAGERLRGNRGRPLSYDDDPVIHVQFEVGTDAISGLERWSGEPVELTPVFDEASAEFLERCFAATYGKDVAQRESLLASHLACARYSHFIWSLATVVNRRLRGRAVPADRWRFYLLMYLPMKLGTTVAARRTPQYGGTHALPPPDWLDEAIAAVIAEFPARIVELERTGLESFSDYNLDLGVIEDDPPEYPLTIATLEQLEGRVADERFR
jgi:hypothetical protein